MRPMIFAAAISAICLCQVQGSEAAAALIPADGDPVLYWNQVLLGNYTSNAVQVTRSVAMFEVALHEAVAATSATPNNRYLTGVSTPGGSTTAAAARASYDILRHLGVSTSAIQDEYDAAIATVGDATARNDGIATGIAIAQAVIDARTGDGSTAPSTYVPSGLPGRWQPTPAANAAAAFPQWGGVDTWMLTSADQFPAAPPPDYRSAEFIAAVQEVKTLGDASLAGRSGDMVEAPRFWVQAFGVLPWVQAALDMAQETGGRTTDMNGSMFAQLGVGVADATIALFDAKYEYDYWRPITAIRNADTVPELGVVPGLDQNDWNSFVTTPNHPSYISGHSAQAAAAAIILEAHLGDDRSFTLNSNGAFGPISRSWDSFDDAAEDAAISRLWGGIHYRFDNEAGLTMGRAVGQYVLNQTALQAVPEPASWAMMIAGFGAVGWSLRVRGSTGTRQAV